MILPLTDRIDRLRQRVSVLRLSQADLARATGLHKDTIGRTLAARTVPLLSTVMVIEQALAQEEAALRLKLPAASGEAA